jgi:hypothetical protein
MQPTAEAVKTVALEALEMSEAYDEKPFIIACKTEIALSETP